MKGELVKTTRTRGPVVPALIADAGDGAARRFVEFFTANIANPNTRLAYAQAVAQFLRWCEERRLTLRTIEPIAVAAYIEELKGRLADPLGEAAPRRHPHALRLAGDRPGRARQPGRLGQGPQARRQEGQDAGPLGRGRPDAPRQHRTRTRPTTGPVPRLMGCGTGPSSASWSSASPASGPSLGMKVEDYYPNGKRWWLRLHEKGGKFHEVPAHHNAEAYLDAYIEAAGIAGDRKGPLFRSVLGKSGKAHGQAALRNGEFVAP